MQWPRKCVFETLAMKTWSALPFISPSSLRRLHLTDLGRLTAVFQRVTEEPPYTSAQQGNMVFCFPEQVTHVVNNLDHTASLLFRDGGRMELALGTTVLPNQDGNRLVLLSEPGGTQNPSQEENQCGFPFPADSDRKKAGFRVVTAPPPSLV